VQKEKWARKLHGVQKQKKTKKQDIIGFPQVENRCSSFPAWKGLR